MSINFIDLERQQARIRPQIDLAISNVLESGQYIMGKACKELEEQLAEYVGVKHCLGCANGTDAIRLALVALEVQPGDMVLTTNFTFFATSEVIAELGAIPLLVDIDETYNICLDDLESKILLAHQKNYPIKGIISVDLFGLPANHHRINDLANQYGLWHIEDSAQGFGGRINDKVNGSFGTISTTSFFPAKPLGCYGDGGAIFTDNDNLALILESLRVHGKGAHKYENIRIGYNSRLDTLQAAILIEKLKIFDDEMASKNELANYYSGELAKIEAIRLPIVPKGYVSSWAQYTLRTENRDELMSYLKTKNIPSVVYYPKTMSQTKALENYADYQLGELNNSITYAEKVLSLPMHAYLSTEERHYITENILSYFK